MYSQNANEYVIKNVGWNFEIAPSQSITYGYTLSGNDIALPDGFEIYSKRVDKTEGYDVQYNITKSWETGVEGNIVITNTSDAPIEAWTLSFDSNFTIGNLWDGRVLENNGTSYTIAAEEWTNPVQPNSSMSIGFVGSKAADVEALLSNFRLTEVVIGEGGTVTPIDPPVEEIEITANAVYDEESGNISVSWISNKQDGTFDVLMSEDGENFVSVGTVESFSKFVYTPENDFETLYFKVVQTVGEKSAESNVVAVAKSAEDIAISAEATYDEESGKITVSWTSNKENGTFEVFVSEDGESFTSVDTVEDVTEFIYSPNYEFDVLYFKIKQTIGELSAESNIVTIINDEEDDQVDDVMSWDEMVDTDGDGLPDYIEYEYGTDINNIDTDGDGLSDGYEVLNCSTDPALFDSDGSGISDADEDLDGDGLSNIEEYRLGTAPIVKDSDNDGLSDGEEVNIHNTDPLVYDSDSDGICDGDEITKGLNPNNPATFGVPDSEYTFEQTLSADNDVFNLINYDENPFKLFLKLNAAGNAKNSVNVSKSGYSIIMDNESILGCVPEIDYDKNLKVDNIEISFDISPEYLIEPYSVSDNELTGIHKYNIFTYNEDLNTLMPVATEYDEANSRIYTNVDNVGTYFVVDMNKWIDQLGIKSNSEPASTAAYSLLENSNVESEFIDVAFLIYNTQQYSNVIKKQLTTTIGAMYSNYDNIRVFFVVYTGDGYVCGLTGNRYAESPEEAANIINRLSFTPASATVSTVSGFNAVSNLEWRENSQRHMFMIDALIEPMCKFDMPSYTAITDNGINTAICYDAANANASIYKAMTTNTYGNVVAIDRFLIPLITFPEKDDTMLLSTNLIPVELDKDITKNYVDAADDLYYNEDKRESYADFADTDNDGLYDFEEINFGTDLISFNDNDKAKLPTFAECLASTNNTNIITAMDIYSDKSFYEELMNKNILLVNSDPTSEDGDGDGILDFDEVEIVKKELSSSTAEISTFSTTAINDKDGDGIPDDVENAEPKLDPNRIDTVVNLYAETIDKVVINNYIKDYDSSLSGIDYYKTGSIGLDTDKSWIEMLVTKNSKDEFTNNIIFHVNVNYLEYKSGTLSASPLSFSDVLKDKTGDSSKFKDNIEKMLNIRWKTSNVAGDYDFYKGMKIKTELKIHFLNAVDIKSKEYFTLEIHTSECGVSNVKEGKIATIYNSQCKVRPNIKATITKKDKLGNIYTVDTYDGQELNSDTSPVETGKIIKIIHSDLTNGSGKTTKYLMEADGVTLKKDINGNKINNYNYCKYNDNQKTYDKMCGTLAHEFGHVLGLADNYADSNHNKNYHQANNCKRLAADESNLDNATKNKYADMYKEFGTTDMLMHNNGYVSLNDIEMVIYAFKQGKWQYYTPYGCGNAGHDNISIAIRSRPLRYANNDKSGSITYYSYS